MRKRREPLTYFVSVGRGRRGGGRKLRKVAVPGHETPPASELRTSSIYLSIRCRSSAIYPFAVRWRKFMSRCGGNSICPSWSRAKFRVKPGRLWDLGVSVGFTAPHIRAPSILCEFARFLGSADPQIAGPRVPGNFGLAANAASQESRSIPINARYEPLSRFESRFNGEIYRAICRSMKALL